jgi:hypothetical protein
MTDTIPVTGGCCFIGSCRASADEGMLIRQVCPDYWLYLSQKPPGLSDTIRFAVRR